MSSSAASLNYRRPVWLLHAMTDGLLASAVGNGPILDSCAVGPPSVRPWASAVELAIEPRRVMMSLNFQSSISFYPLDIAIREWHHRDERVDLRLVGWSGGLLPYPRLRFLALSLLRPITCFKQLQRNLRPNFYATAILEKSLLPLPS